MTTSTPAVKEKAQKRSRHRSHSPSPAPSPHSSDSEKQSRSRRKHKKVQIYIFYSMQCIHVQCIHCAKWTIYSLPSIQKSKKKRHHTVRCPLYVPPIKYTCRFILLRLVWMLSHRGCSVSYVLVVCASFFLVKLYGHDCSCTCIQIFSTVYFHEVLYAKFKFLLSKRHVSFSPIASFLWVRRWNKAEKEETRDRPHPFRSTDKETQSMYLHVHHVRHTKKQGNGSKHTYTMEHSASLDGIWICNYCLLLYIPTNLQNSSSLRGNEWLEATWSTDK